MSGWGEEQERFGGDSTVKVDWRWVGVDRTKKTGRNMTHKEKANSKLASRKRSGYKWPHKK